MAQLPSKKHADSGVRSDPRVSFLLKEGEKLVPCPYDKSHFVLDKKLVWHLNKCRHNYLNKMKGKEPQIVICRHSFEHHVSVDELESHEMTCPNNKTAQEEAMLVRLRTERRLNMIGANAQECIEQDTQKKLGLDKQVASEDGIVRIVSEDRRFPNWEPSDPSPEPDFEKPEKRFLTYDPREHVRRHEHDFILNPQGLTRSEREAHREKMNSGKLPEEEEMPEIRPHFRGHTRDTRTNVGFPGWELSDGNRPAPGQSKRMGP